MLKKYLVAIAIYFIGQPSAIKLRDFTPKIVDVIYTVTQSSNFTEALQPHDIYPSKKQLLAQIDQLKNKLNFTQQGIERYQKSKNSMPSQYKKKAL